MEGDNNFFIRALQSPAPQPAQNGIGGPPGLPIPLMAQQHQPQQPPASHWNTHGGMMPRHPEHHFPGFPGLIPQQQQLQQHQFQGQLAPNYPHHPMFAHRANGQYPPQLQTAGGPMRRPQGPHEAPGQQRQARAGRPKKTSRQQEVQVHGPRSVAPAQFNHNPMIMFAPQSVAPPGMNRQLMSPFHMAPQSVAPNFFHLQGPGSVAVHNNGNPGASHHHHQQQPPATPFGMMPPGSVHHPPASVQIQQQLAPPLHAPEVPMVQDDVQIAQPPPNNNRVEELERQLADLQAQLQIARGEIQTHLDTITDQQSRVGPLNVELTTTQDMLAKKEKEHKLEMEQKNEENEKLKSKIAELEEAMEQMASAVNAAVADTQSSAASESPRPAPLKSSSPSSLSSTSVDFEEQMAKRRSGSGAQEVSGLSGASSPLSPVASSPASDAPCASQGPSPTSSGASQHLPRRRTCSESSAGFFGDQLFDLLEGEELLEDQDMDVDGEEEVVALEDLSSGNLEMENSIFVVTAPRVPQDIDDEVVVMKNQTETSLLDRQGEDLQEDFGMEAAEIEDVPGPSEPRHAPPTSAPEDSDDVTIVNVIAAPVLTPQEDAEVRFTGTKKLPPVTGSFESFEDAVDYWSENYEGDYFEREFQMVHGEPRNGLLNWIDLSRFHFDPHGNTETPQLVWFASVNQSSFYLVAYPKEVPVDWNKLSKKEQMLWKKIWTVVKKIQERQRLEGLILWLHGKEAAAAGKAKVKKERE